MHLVVIVGIALLVFGPKKLPELGRGLGDGIRGFRSAMKDIRESADVELRTLNSVAQCSPGLGSCVSIVQP
jgi:sec-independent protein translocase protein TatA